MSSLRERSFLNLPVVDWAWLLALALWRIIIGTRHGLGVDEAHYVLYGLRPDWSYFDHPPLTGWIEAFFLFVFGKSEWVARLPAVISGFIASILIFRFISDSTKDIRASRWATIAINSSFLPAALWIMFLPDTILLVLVLWLVKIISCLLERDHFCDWLALGVCLGLCGLSKYTAIFFVFSLVGIVFTEKAWGKIKPLGLGIATLLALVIVSPVIFWNMNHHWISFSYQQNHVMGSTKINFNKFFIFLVTQFVAYSPFLVVPALYTLWKKKNLNQHTRIALWIALPTLAFFTYTSLKDEVLPHWTLVGWALIIPVGVVLGISQSRYLKVSVAISALLTLFVMTELTWPFLKFPPYQSPYADLIGWVDLHNEIQIILKNEQPGTYSIGVPNWTLGSRANYYFADLASVFVLDNRFDQFDLWEEGQKKTPDILIVSWKGFDLSQSEANKCKKLEPVKTKVYSVNGSPVNSVQLAWCRQRQL